MSSPVLAELPSDPVELEKTLRARLVQILQDVSGVTANILQWPAYPDSDEEDIQVSTVTDPITGLRQTNVMTIGMPTVQETPYTDDNHTKLALTYPITFDLGVVDLWDDDTLEFKSSSQMLIGIYMRARNVLKYNRTLGFKNVEHDYLQQVNVSDVVDDEGNAELHAADWSITIRVMATRG